MTKILILLFVTLFAGAQKDTIFLKNNGVIACTILGANINGVDYRTDSLTRRFTDINRINSYSKNGQRTNCPKKNLNQKLPVDSVNITDELQYMRNCLNKFNTQYSTGMGIVLIGGTAAVSSFFIKDTPGLQKGMGIGGLAMMVIGTVVNFDAHKWIGRAGWGVSGKGNMVQVRYRLK